MHWINIPYILLCNYYNALLINHLVAVEIAWQVVASPFDLFTARRNIVNCCIFYYIEVKDIA